MHPESWGSLGRFDCLPCMQRLTALRLSIGCECSQLASLSLPCLQRLQLDLFNLNNKYPLVCDLTTCPRLQQATIMFFGQWGDLSSDIDLSGLVGVHADLLKLMCGDLPAASRFIAPLHGWEFGRVQLHATSSRSPPLDSLMAQLAWASGGKLSWEFFPEATYSEEFVAMFINDMARAIDDVFL